MKLPTKIVLIIVAVLVVIGLTQFDFSSSPKPEKNSPEEQIKPIVETAWNTEGLSSFVTMIKTAGIVDSLNTKGPYTVFAPNDKAFANLPEETYASLMKPKNKDELKALLMNHIVKGKIYASDFENGQTLATLGGQKITILLGDDGVMVNDAEITQADVEASNGVIHIINTVLLDSAAVSTESN